MDKNDNKGDKIAVCDVGYHGPLLAQLLIVTISYAIASLLRHICFEEKELYSIYVKTAPNKT